MGCMCVRPKTCGESRETCRLRGEFEQIKRKLSALPPALQTGDVQAFVSGRRDPPQNVFAENQNQWQLREGIQEMEDLLDPVSEDG